MCRRRAALCRAKSCSTSSLGKKIAHVCFVPHLSRDTRPQQADRGLLGTVKVTLSQYLWNNVVSTLKGLVEKVPISDVNELRPDPYSRASHAALVRDLEADG